MTCPSASIKRSEVLRVPASGHNLLDVSSGTTGRGSIDAYEALAPFYDEFNAANDYEKWLGEVLLPELEKQGLRQMTGRVLDVGCGTGRALQPLDRRGWSVTGCDFSKAMLQQAMKNHGRHRWAGLRVADARNVPDFGTPFDLIIALNDVINYLTEDGDLELAFEGMQRNLVRGGLVCFDANTLGLFEGSFTAGSQKNEASCSPLKDRGWEWTGLSTDPQPGGIFEAELAGKGVEPAIHRERHWRPEEVQAAMQASGLCVLAVLGQREDDDRILLEDPPDEQRHYKLIYIGGHGE